MNPDDIAPDVLASLCADAATSPAVAAGVRAGVEAAVRVCGADPRHVWEALAARGPAMQRGALADRQRPRVQRRAP